MDFSEAYQFTEATPSFSPDGKFIASAVEARCVIRDSETLIVYHMFSCMDKVKHIEWSPTGKHVLCAMYTRSVVQVWDVDDPSWTCKLDAGPAGLVRALWSASGSDVITVADFNVRMSRWDLRTQNCSHLPAPKHADRGIHYSKCGQHLAFLERVNLKDYLLIYTEGAPLEDSIRFRLSTQDAEDFAWNPDGSVLAVKDSPLYHQVLVYNKDGTCVKKFQAEGKGLGVRSLCWSACGQLLAIGSYGPVVKILNNITWNECAAFEHSSKVSNPDTVVFIEERDPDEGNEDDAEQRNTLNRKAPTPPPSQARSRYTVADVPVEVPMVMPPSNRPNPAMGVRILSTSQTSRYMATINDSQKAAVWIWDLHTLSLVCILKHEQPVTGLEWAPDRDTLAICTASCRLHMWSPDGASCVHTPLQNLCTRSVVWRWDGLAAAVCDLDRFCVAYTG